jgi:hypothetical protein
MGQLARQMLVSMIYAMRCTRIKSALPVTDGQMRFSIVLATIEFGEIVWSCRNCDSFGEIEEHIP